MRDPQTLKSKAYGFVSFTKKVEAENAIAQMNGQKLGSRSIITNWHYPTMKKIANDSELEEKVRQIYKDNIKYLVKKNADLAKDFDKLKDENTQLKRELASWKEIKDDNEYLKNKVEKLKKKMEISGGGDEATKSELIEIRHELNALKSKHEKTVQELVLAKKKNVIHSSLVSKQQMREDKIKDLVKKNADLTKDRIDFDKLKDDLKNVKAKLKVITDENEGLNIQVKENEALKKTLKIQQEFLEIAKSHLKGEPVQKPDLEREVRRMLIEQFGQEATEKLGIEIEDGEILDDHNPDQESGIEIIIDEPEKEIEVIEPEKEIEVVQLDMD